MKDAESGINMEVGEEMVNTNDSRTGDDSAKIWEDNEHSPKNIPTVGMKFLTVDEVYQFYKTYAYRVGFPIRRRSSRKGHSGNLESVIYTCSREGNRSGNACNQLNPHPTSQTGCKAKLTASTDATGLWSIIAKELTHKMYCNIKCSMEVPFGSEYKIVEDVQHDGKIGKQKTLVVSFNRGESEVFCSCHMFEFRGILCKHAISVLLLNHVWSVPDKYILRRWRRDVSRLYMRIKINYNGWIVAPGQERYDELCRDFTRLADIATHNESGFKDVKKWIEMKTIELATLRSNSLRGCNLEPNSCVGEIERGITSADKYLTSIAPKEKVHLGRLGGKVHLSLTQVNAKTKKGKNVRPDGSPCVGNQSTACQPSQRHQPDQISFLELLHGNRLHDLDSLNGLNDT
ncbi:FAR1-related sequence 2, partial [Striga asiatica]